MANGTAYCTNCTKPGDAEHRFCEACGAPRMVSRQRRAQNVALILNELQAGPMFDVLSAQQRARLGTSYEDELRRLTATPVATAAATTWRAPAPNRHVAATPAAAAAAPPRTPAPPREPMDWSWLGEHQANLFLFAGAFLTVIAALIYVGYSGQAVSGALKMSLLIGYTLAFLAAGWACLRTPRVEVAGRVFLAVGALLVPMNFVAARELFGEGDLSAEAMWLSGSIVTAAFYASFAWLGLGRMYAFGAGLAAISGGIAVIVIGDVPTEWAPAVMIVVALALVLTDCVPGQRVRARVGAVWTWQGQALAVAAALFALVLAPYIASGVEPLDEINRWYLPATLALLTVAAAVPMLLKRQPQFGVASLLAFAGAWVSAPFAVDAAAEWYGVAFASLALAIGLATPFVRSERVAALLPARSGDFLYIGGAAATLASAVVFVTLLMATADEFDPYVFDARWTIALAAVFGVAFYAIDALIMRRRASMAGVAVTFATAAPALVFAYDGALEHYAYALAAAAAIIMAASRWAPALGVIGELDSSWRDDAAIVAYVAAAAGALVAVGLAVDADGPNTPYEPQTRWFLPLTFVVAMLAAAIDAARRARIETSAAVSGSLIAIALSIPWALEARPAYYGVALATAGIALAAGGRIWTPAWFDARVRDITAAIAVAAATIPFEDAYVDLPRAGAGVHLAAACFFAAAALRTRNTNAAPTRFDIAAIVDARVETLWLYASGFSAVGGYLWILRSMPAAEDAEAGTLAVPLMLAALAFVSLGALAKRLWPSAGLHLYVIALLVSIASLASASDTHTLAILLTIFVVASALVAVYEDAPQLGAPAVLYGFLGVIAWRIDLDASEAVVPAAYAAIGLVAYALAFALRSAAGAWSRAMRAGGALYALAAPVSGFLIMSGMTGDLSGTPTYQWTTLGVAVVGMAALAESAMSGRRWIMVPASSVLVAALLLQVARLEPENAQAYTVIIGAYLLGLSIVGLGRMKLWPDLDSASPYIEALGVVTIVLPSFLQSLDGGWRYEVILVVESALFLAISIVLRRRGMLAASAGFLALSGGRALFDAVNAMPNWIVVMLAGMALLAVGVGILLGRDRWDRWQSTLLSWWSEAGNGAPAH